MKIVMTGARGVIGSRLCRALLSAGHSVVSLSRTAAPENGNPLLTTVVWDGMTSGEWTRHVDGADAVINLAGEPIAAGRWTAARKARISASRIGTTKILVEAIARAHKKPGVLINASAVGYYGNVPEGEVTERHAAGTGFLQDTCVRWEKEACAAQAYVQRVVLLRTGIVLDSSGGALPRMALPFRFFIGGKIGGGKQWMPWIHHADVTGLILHALMNPGINGPMNISAPGLVRMEEFCVELGRALHRPSWLPVPSSALSILLGEMAEIILGGQRAVPTVALASGYSFRFSTLETALKDLFQHSRSH